MVPPLEADAEAWLRFVLAVRRQTKLPAPLAEVTPQQLLTLWSGARREIAARLVLAAARERLCPAALRGGALSLELDGEPLELPLRRSGAFELHQADLERADDPRLEDPLGIAARLCDAAMLAGDDRRRIAVELRDSIRNLAQARLAGHLRHLVAQTLPSDLPSEPRLEDPEHFVVDGHPWHPMTRTRLGLRPSEVLRYASEQLAATPVACIDLAAGEVQRAGAWAEVGAALFGPAPAGFVRLPIHPAQRRRLVAIAPQAVAAGHLRPVDAPPRASRSLLSLRTVALTSSWHLKLGCNVHTTSARRVVSPMSVANGPRLSAWLADIQARDPHTRSLQLMAEPAAAGLAPARYGAQAGELGAILRTVPPLRGDARAWVCAAVGERWPGRDELVLERACAGYPGGRSERLRSGLRDWIAALVPPALRLLSFHGVALELHLQNTLVTVDGGRVGAMRVRDLGGVRLHRPAVAGLELAPGSFIASDDRNEVRGKLEHSLIHAHLTHLFAVAETLGVPAEASWAALRRCIDDCYRRWRDEAGLSRDQRATIADDHRRLLAPRVRVKALLRMRLHRRSSDYDYSEVDNALATAQTERTGAESH